MNPTLIVYSRLDFKVLLSYLNTLPSHIKKSLVGNTKFIQLIRTSYQQLALKREKLKVGKVKIEIRELYFYDIFLTRQTVLATDGKPAPEVINHGGVSTHRQAYKLSFWKVTSVLVLSFLIIIYGAFISDNAWLVEMFQNLLSLGSEPEIPTSFIRSVFADLDDSGLTNDLPDTLTMIAKDLSLLF